MPVVCNDWPKQLLAWHGHRGGVRVPFEGKASPLEDEEGRQVVVATRLIKRLRSLAADLAHGVDAPRFVFLVGGPGNGKSEAVQDFLEHLDAELGAQGQLTSALQAAFKPDKMLKWCVEIHGADLPVSTFQANIGRLIVIQDASASEIPDQDAASVLAEYIEDLFTHPVPLPVFVCCVNRGLLTRCLRAARDANLPPYVTEVLKAIIQATALGKDALTKDRRSCWPLSIPEHSLDGSIACWPLDMESLLLPAAELDLPESPLEQALRQAVSADKWQNGACSSCDYASLCPFLQNAFWLQDEVKRGHLTTILRRAELVTAQRWNFRDMFSLVAELLVGDEGDFYPNTHPCTWVQQRTIGALTEGPVGLESSYKLISRLYPNALFPILITGPIPEGIEAISETAAALDSSLPHGDIPSPTHIRRLLRERIAPRLDPALLSPPLPNDPLSKIEYAYSQSIAQGNSVWPAGFEMAIIERVFFDHLRVTDDFDTLSRDFAQVTAVQRFMRTVAATLAKRSVGVRTGVHAELTFLVEYENSIRDVVKLFSLTNSLRSLMGDGSRFLFNALESFGQPQDDGGWLVALKGAAPVLSISPAPSVSKDLPAHDLPFISVENHAIPLTFDLYLALRLRKEGFSNSSLPASVRAAIDRIRHLIAGQQCRDVVSFEHLMAEFVIEDHGSIVVLPVGERVPSYRAKGD